MARHERHVAGHLDQLVALRDNSGGAGDALAAVLEAYALILHEISHRHHGADLSALVHQGPDVARAQHQLSHFIQGIVADAAKVGDVRDDISPAELTNYALQVANLVATIADSASVVRSYLEAIGGEIRIAVTFVDQGTSRNRPRRL
jgi:ABC-type transporter Mla subunit MlaD